MEEKIKNGGYYEIRLESIGGWEPICVEKCWENWE